MPDLKKQYRLAPCPSYDVETMESWLEDEAQGGYFLTEDGFFFGVAVFEKKAPCKVRYRLEPKEVLDWSAESLFPNQEARALCEEYGWQYVADRGKFFIYRSETAAARELNTDPEIQAMALKPMWDREKDNRRWALFWMVFYPLIRYLLGRETLLRMSIGMGTWLFLMGLGIGLWMYIRSEVRLRYVARLRRKLAAGESLDRGKNWQPRRKCYWTGNILYMLLIIVWVSCVFDGCAKNLENANRIPLAEYTKELPFADMTELVECSLEMAQDVTGESVTSENEAMAPLLFEESGMYPGDMNYIEEKKDLLASTVIKMNQNGSVRLPDGRTYEAILDVQYYNTAAPWLARILAWEYLQEGKSTKRFQQYSLPELPVDEAYYFTSYFPTLVLRKGDVLLVVELVQFTGENQVTWEPEVWARSFAESLQ